VNGAGEFEIRGYRAGDERAIVAGFAEAFHVERTLEEWRWRFPPAPEPAIELGFDRDGELVAHYAAIRVRMRRSGRDFDAAQVVDVFTGRKLGLFHRGGPLNRVIESFLTRRCGAGRIELLFGFPSLRAHALGRATGVYPADGEVTRLAAAARASGPRLGRWRWLQRGFDAHALDALWRAAASRYALAAVRDAAWFRRRYLTRPGVAYDQLGVRRGGRVAVWGVLRLDQEPARWADLVWDGADPADLEALARAARAAAAAAGRRELELWLGGDPAAAAVLAAGDFRAGPHPDLRLVCRSFVADLDHAEAVAGLYVTLGDSDLV
jgi:hypothetical protein